MHLNRVLAILLLAAGLLGISGCSKEGGSTAPSPSLPSGGPKNQSPSMPGTAGDPPSGSLVGAGGSIPDPGPPPSAPASKMDVMRPGAHEPGGERFRPDTSKVVTKPSAPAQNIGPDRARVAHPQN